MAKMAKYVPQIGKMEEIAKNISQKSIKLFDVSLRDGIQPIKKIYTLGGKKDLLHKIIEKYKPSAIEIGSIVNPKIVPQMANSIELHNYVLEKGLNEKIDIYMLTPTLKSVLIGKKNNITNFSFITSVSNKFQLKNINKSLQHTKLELADMFSTIDKTNNVKLYLSCVNECPIDGIQNNEHIINEFMYYYYRYNHILTDICISDTCGTLNGHDFRYIIDTLIYQFGVKPNHISVHFHIANTIADKINISAMLYRAIDNNILKVDVSCLNDSGGCHVTLDKKKMKANVSYDILDTIGIL